MAGTWNELLNTDSELFGGGGIGNLGSVDTVPLDSHDRHQSSLALE